MGKLISLEAFRARRTLPPDVLNVVDIDRELAELESAMSRAEQRMAMFPYLSEPWSTALESYVVALADSRELEEERRKVVGEVAGG